MDTSPLPQNWLASGIVSRTVLLCSTRFLAARALLSLSTTSPLPGAGMVSRRTSSPVLLVAALMPNRCRCCNSTYYIAKGAVAFPHEFLFAHIPMPRCMLKASVNGDFISVASSTPLVVPKPFHVAFIKRRNGVRSCCTYTNHRQTSG